MTCEIFDNLSHLTYKEECENTRIRKVNKGEEYHCYWPKEKIEEDAKYRSWFMMAIHDFPYVAKEDRWYSGDGTYLRTVDEVENDWNDHVKYRETKDKFYNKSWVVLHYLDGSDRKKYFSTNDEMFEFIETIKKTMEHPIKIDID